MLSVNQSSKQSIHHTHAPFPTLQSHKGDIFLTDGASPGVQFARECYGYTVSVITRAARNLRTVHSSAARVVVTYHS